MVHIQTLFFTHGQRFSHGLLGDPPNPVDDCQSQLQEMKNITDAADASETVLLQGGAAADASSFCSDLVAVRPKNIKNGLEVYLTSETLTSLTQLYKLCSG